MNINATFLGSFWPSGRMAMLFTASLLKGSRKGGDLLLLLLFIRLESRPRGDVLETLSVHKMAYPSAFRDRLDVLRFGYLVARSRPKSAQRLKLQAARATLLMNERVNFSIFFVIVVCFGFVV